MAMADRLDRASAYLISLRPPRYQKIASEYQARHPKHRQPENHRYESAHAPPPTTYLITIFIKARDSCNSKGKQPRLEVIFRGLSQTAARK